MAQILRKNMKQEFLPECIKKKPRTNAHLSGSKFFTPAIEL